MRKNNLSVKSKCLIIISAALTLITLGTNLTELYKNANYEISYEYINVKDMASPKITNKKENDDDILTLLFGTKKNNGEVVEVDIATKENVQEVEFTALKNTTPTSAPKKIWYLPTEIGQITQNPHYGHVALDITSPRGSMENIFPVANGRISAIYKDNAGAKIVTVLHDIDGKKYTSQYAHLSQYASNIYVGKEVTINDSLGLMGSTGYSTGIHLHLVVVDCALFDPNDYNCKDLNSFFRYANKRLSEGYIGLGTMFYVPGTWTTR